MAENWRDQLPDEIKGSEALANFEDVNQLAQGFLDAKKYQGSSIKIPGEDAGEDDIKAFNDKLLEKVPSLMYKPDFENPDQSTEFYRSLGMPEDSDGYSFPEVEVPDGVNLQTDRLDGFREIAHKNGLSVSQFQGMMRDIISNDIAAAQDTQEFFENNHNTIKEKFGMAYKDNMDKINTLLTKTGAPETIVNAAKEGKLHVDTIDWLYQMGKQMGGEGFDFKDTNQDGGNIRPPAMTPEEAQAAIDEINRNNDHPYWKGTGEEKARATQRMIQLMKWANPESAA